MSLPGTHGAEGPEHLDVLVVGAGLSGIAAAHHLQTTCPWASYAIFEARGAIGGTWDLFRYPGIRSDSDMYTLGYPFRPWPGEKSIADGADILQYIQDTAREEGIDRNIRFGHRILSADWSTQDSRWHITAQRTDLGTGRAGETIELTCGFLFSCSGYYRYDSGYTPEFDGLDTFQGAVVHPQDWPEDLDYSDKQVVVIGSGATAITLIPSLARTAASVTMLQRSPTYIASVPDVSPVAQRLSAALPRRWAGPATRWFHALYTQGVYQFCKRFPEAAKKMLREGVVRQLPPGYDVDTHFTPRYDPWDQRLCATPNGEFFKALRSGSTSVVTDKVDRFTESGVRLESGAELKADLVITATGLERLFVGGIQVSLDGEPADLPSRLLYKGSMLEGVPNFAVALGYTNASWMLKCDLTCDYIARLLNVMRARGSERCMPVDPDGSVNPDLAAGLAAGYFTRTADEFPRPGDKGPWRMPQSYLHDFRELMRSPAAEVTLEFSDPPTGAAAKRQRPLLARHRKIPHSVARA